jgi:hypothetical protein
MLCVERFHRIMMATLLVVTILLFITAKEVFALALLGFMAVMMTIWAVFDFCPALKILSKFMKPCKKD